MKRRHHYPSGLMRLSRRRKGQAITVGAVFSLEMRRGWRRMTVKLIVQKDTPRAHKQTHKGCLHVWYSYIITA